MKSSSTIVARSLLAVFLSSAAFGCNNDPAKGKTQATVTSATAAVGATPPAAGAVNYAFSNDGSKLEFTGAKVSAKHDGAFKAFRGTIGVVDGDATKSQVNVEIDIASLEIEPAKLGAHCHVNCRGCVAIEYARIKQASERFREFIRAGPLQG